MSGVEQDPTRNGVDPKTTDERADTLSTRVNGNGSDCYELSHQELDDAFCEVSNDADAAFNAVSCIVHEFDDVNCELRKQMNILSARRAKLAKAAYAYYNECRSVIKTCGK